MSQPTNQQRQNEELLAYLAQQLPAEKAQQLEEELLDDPFAQEAAEGLEQLGSNTALQRKVYALNKELTAKLNKASVQRKEGRFVNQQLPYQILAVIIVIALCSVGFWLIREYLAHMGK